MSDVEVTTVVALANRPVVVSRLTVAVLSSVHFDDHRVHGVFVSADAAKSFATANLEAGPWSVASDGDWVAWGALYGTILFCVKTFEVQG